MTHTAPCFEKSRILNIEQQCRHKLLQIIYRNVKKHPAGIYAGYTHVQANYNLRHNHFTIERTRTNYENRLTTYQISSILSKWLLQHVEESS